MNQEDKWLQKCIDVMEFMEKNHRNPSKHNDEERCKYHNWIKHNRQLMNKGLMKEDRLVLFKELLALGKQYRHVNQYL